MRTKFLIINVLWLALGLGHSWAAAAVPPVLVYTNGWVVCPTNHVTSGLGPGAVVQFDFGLPALPPSERLQDDGKPILHTIWETGGVRYTQKVLVTQLGTASPVAYTNDAVLLIQITGHNLAGEYTNAAASLAIWAGDRPLELELRGGLVYAVGIREPRLLGVLDVPGEGIAATNGTRLKFRGSMPPGTTGAMTLKLPARLLVGEVEINRLRDLEFDEEAQRVKKFWGLPGPRPPAPAAWGAWGEVK